MFNRNQVALWISSFFLFAAIVCLQVMNAPSAGAQGPGPIFLPYIAANCPKLLVQDFSFETGLPNASWATTSTVASGILDNSSIPSPNPTHNGAWKAWLGGSDSVQESLWQTMTVPASTTGLQVSFWRRVSTQESNPLINDRLDVQIRNSSGVVLETLYNLFDGDAGTTWVQHTLIPSSSYAGQTIQLAFFAMTDSADPTSFFIDDVIVTAACSP